MTNKKTVKKSEYGKSLLTIHREIRSTVDKIAKNDGAQCVLVKAIEKELGKDSRTIRVHLTILEEAGYGRFISNGKLFCLQESEKKQ